MKSGAFSRRNFIRANVIGGLGTTFLVGCTSSKNYSTQSTGSSPIKGNDTISQIGGMSLVAIRDKYHSELFDHFLPGMDRLVVDHELGGFMCDIDNRSGKQLSSGKRAWFEGRGIWLYSFLYNHFGKNSKFLEVARKSKDFILKHQPSDSDFWISSFTKEGLPSSGPGDIFGNLYIAEGLAEYAVASGEIEYFNLAKKILLQCARIYDSKDYEYSAEKNIKGPRILNHWMIMLCNATQMLENQHDVEIEALAERCVDAIMNKHLNPDWGLLDITLSHDMSRLPDPGSPQMVSFGLGVQALWMVLMEALRKKDVQLFNNAKELFKRHVEVARDNVYGGYYWSLDHVSSFTFKLGKTLSLHDEVLIGALLLIENQADDWAEKCFADTYAYIQDKFIKSGHVFAVEGGDRKVVNITNKGMGIYHHPRQLAINLLAIERIIGRTGKVSGVFNQ